MDPLSVIASCIGICDGLSKVYALANKHIHRDKSLRKELGVLVAKLPQYRGVIESIKVQAELDKDSEDHLRLSALGLADGPLESCKLATQRLKKRLENLPHKIVAGKFIFGKVIDDETAEALKMFEGTLPVLQLAVVSDQKTIASKVLEYMKDVGKELQSFVTQQQDKQKAESEAKERQDLKDWLTRLDSTTTCQECLKGKSEMSGRWFLDERFGPWAKSMNVNDQKTIMWMRGASGMGKTTLLSLSIRYLLEEIGLKTDEGLAYFYCSSSISESQSAENMVKSFIEQLCVRGLPVAWDHLRGLRERCQDKQDPNVVRQPSIDELTKTLQNILAGCGKVVFFLDALNESEHHDSLVKVIKTLSFAWNVRILVSSTQALDLIALLEDAGVDHGSNFVDRVDLQASMVDLDIADYISTVIARERRLKRVSSSVKQQIYINIVTKAKGSFRWAECQINAIFQRCRSPAAIESALSSMALDLGSFYMDILGQFPTDDSGPARMALLWLAFSIRPLYIDELAEAMGLGESSQFADPSGRLFRETAEDILRNCRGLVDYNATTKTAKLEHDSVKQFLFSSRLGDSSEYSYFFIDQVEDLGLLCSLMLRYLNLPRLSSGYCRKRDLDARFEVSPLLRYVSVALPQYLEFTAWESSSYGGMVVDGLKSLIESAHLPRGGNWGTWAQVNANPGSNIPRSPISPFYDAASHGYVRILKLIISWEGDKNMEVPGGRFSSTPLHVACARGRTEVVRLLLSMGANTKEVNAIGTSGIGWAQRWGFSEIEQLMFENGAPAEPEQPEDYDYDSDCSLHKPRLELPELPRLRVPERDDTRYRRHGVLRRRHE
ncbi:hypothetical protein IWZ01DRAFT_552783 [Phyllosticta capitalensis]